METAIETTSTIKPAGSFGTSRERTTSTTIAEAPTANVVRLASSSSPARRQVSSKKFPSSVVTPNSFGACDIAIVRARPVMNPVSTGLAKNSARKPSLPTPAATRMPPVRTADIAESATNVAVSPPARGATATAERAAIAELGPTLSSREVPKIAYRSSAASAAYRPACAGTPASDA